jgi:hypothetical protein
VSQGPYDPQQEGQGYGQQHEGQGYGQQQGGQGYGQQPTPPPGQYAYGQPAQPPTGPYGYGQDVDTGATLALILSIVGLVVCQPLCIVSLILSNNAQRKVQETAKWQDQSQVKAARIISIIGIVLLAIGIVIGIVYAIAIFAAINNS